MSARPTLSLTRKTPLKSKKASTNGVKKKAPVKPWVDTINDLGQYKPTKTEVESRKNQRKSNNKILAKVAMNDKRMLNDPDRQKFIEQQVMRDIQRQPSQVCCEINCCFFILFYFYFHFRMLRLSLLVPSM